MQDFRGIDFTIALSETCNAIDRDSTKAGYNDLAGNDTG